jgi:hypothetical protein
VHLCLSGLLHSCNPQSHGCVAAEVAPPELALEKRRGSGPLEEPTPSGPKAFLRGWRLP